MTQSFWDILAMENAGQLIEDEELRAQIKGSGIGTSATRAEIIKKLIRIGYLKLNKKTQVITPENFGEMVYEVEHPYPNGVVAISPPQTGQETPTFLPALNALASSKEDPVVFGVRMRFSHWAYGGTGSAFGGSFAGAVYRRKDKKHASFYW